MKKTLKNILLASGLALGMLGFNSCGPKSVPKPTATIYVNPEYNGGLFEGDNVFVGYNGENLENCVLKIENSVKKVRLGLKPGETATLTFGINHSPIAKIYPGENDFSVVCNNEDVANKSVNFKEANMKVNFSPLTTESYVNLKPSWDGDKGSFSVKVDTNVDPSRIQSIEGTLTPGSGIVSAVNNTLNEDPTNDFYRGLDKQLPEQTAQGKTQSFFWYYPGGDAKYKVVLQTNDGKSLESNVNVAFLAEGVVKLLFPREFSDSFGSYEPSTNTVTDIDESPRDLSPGSSDYTVRVYSFYGSKNPSEAYQRSDLLENNNIFDTFTEPVEYVAPNLAAFANWVTVYDVNVRKKIDNIRTFYLSQSDANNNVNGTEVTVHIVVDPAQGP